MSFSGQIRDELSRHQTEARHCNLAELSALIRMSGEIKQVYKAYAIKFHTENLGVARKCFTLLEKTFNIKADIAIRRNIAKGSCSYDIYARGGELLAIQNAMVQAVCCEKGLYQRSIPGCRLDE